MRILVVGAGAIGGYFGGRLLESGRDVTFLVRPRRAEELATSGLRIHSRYGDLNLSAPPTILADGISSAFDLVLLSCKAYDLDSAMASFAPAVGPGTAILPLLNGMLHLDALDERFGADRVLGGKCVIAATLNERREIAHLNDFHEISFGERDGKISERVVAIDQALAGARFDHIASPVILLDMWEKWVFLATLAGSTCLFRAAVGDIAASPGGRDLVLRLLEECRTIAAAAGYPPRPACMARAYAMLTATGSTLTASMLRDMENGAPIEADHIIGDLLRLGSGEVLPVVLTALKAYEARRARSMR